MDINLKNNKNINLKILILGICLALLPILLSISSGRGFNYIPMCELLVLLDILFSIFLLVTIAIEKNLILKETFIIKLYGNLFLELRILLALAMIYSLFNLYEILLWEYIFTNANTLISFILILTLTYLVLIDMYKLYLFNEANKLENYIYEKSMLYKFSKLIKESLLTKSTYSKLKLSVIFFVIYTTLIYITGYLTSTPYYFDQYVIFLSCIAFSSTIIIIVFLIYISIDINAIEANTHNVANGNYNKIDVKKLLFF